VADQDQIVQQLVELTREIADAGLEPPDEEHFDLAKRNRLDAATDDDERALIQAVAWSDVENLREPHLIGTRPAGFAAGVPLRLSDSG
jgi:hypothetical protein